MLYIPGEEDILKQKPVTVHGSILLAELVAILVVLEHLVTSSSRIKSLRLFSDSQTALGIIYLKLGLQELCRCCKKNKGLYLTVRR